MFKKDLAECVGLWLAEGDQKSLLELTFTNNDVGLIKHFFDTIQNLFNLPESSFRLYIYSPSGEARPPLRLSRVKQYVDSRARKPYFILRLANAELLRKWRSVVNSIVKEKAFRPEILRGFFAGEGNIKTGSHHSRQIRIAQAKRIHIIENIMKCLGAEFVYSPRERAYVLSGRWNWDLFAQRKLADLHPDKKRKFWGAYRTFKEKHYKALYLKESVRRKIGIKPRTSAELASIFSRSQARLQDVLIELKKEGIARNFRVGSKDYWTTKKNLIIISRVKEKYLNALIVHPQRTSDVARKLKVNWKAAHRRLGELARLGLITKKEGVWFVKKTLNRLIVL